MAEKIKKFFAKKKADAKFKLAGPGRRLDDSSTTLVGPSRPQKSHERPHQQPPKGEPSLAKQQAAEAALARLAGKKKDTAFNTSLAAIQAQVRRELDAEKKSGVAASVEPEVRKRAGSEVEASPHLAVQGVYFKCPLISDEVLTREEWRTRIREFLFEQLEEERGLTACLIIHSCNYNRTKITECVNILCRYIDNILANPTEPKFHKIRCSNATFAEKVLPILGATEFLYAAGFRLQKIDNNGTEEDFWVFDEKNIGDLQTLQFLRDAIKSEDRVELEIERNVQVLSPAQAAKRVDLPRDFFALSPEEIKKEQQLRTEAMEKQMQLRTKAMREKDELREIKKYKFALIRVRFPDGLYLQGTFSVYEKYADVLEFVQDNLENPELPFILSTPSGHRLEEKDKESSLADLRLVPATILTFQWDPSIAEDIERASSTYLKPEIMMLMRQL